MEISTLTLAIKCEKIDEAEEAFKALAQAAEDAENKLMSLKDYIDNLSFE